MLSVRPSGNSGLVPSKESRSPTLTETFFFFLLLSRVSCDRPDGAAERKDQGLNGISEISLHDPTINTFTFKDTTWKLLVALCDPNDCSNEKGIVEYKVADAPGDKDGTSPYERERLTITSASQTGGKEKWKLIKRANEDDEGKSDRTGSSEGSRPTSWPDKLDWKQVWNREPRPKEYVTATYEQWGTLAKEQKGEQDPIKNPGPSLLI